MKEVYQSHEDVGAVGATLEDMVRERARRMPAAAVREGREWIPGQAAR